MVAKPIKGGFRIRNVGFPCSGITVSLHKNIHQIAKHVNQGFHPDSLRGEIRETCRELVDLKFRILPALEDVACGKKYQKKNENTVSGKESG